MLTPKRSHIVNANEFNSPEGNRTDQAFTRIQVLFCEVYGSADETDALDDADECSRACAKSDSSMTSRTTMTPHHNLFATVTNFRSDESYLD